MHGSSGRRARRRIETALLGVILTGAALAAPAPAAATSALASAPASAPATAASPTAPANEPSATASAVQASGGSASVANDDSADPGALIPFAELDGTPLAPSAESVRRLEAARTRRLTAAQNPQADHSVDDLGAFELSNDVPQLDVPHDFRPYVRGAIFPLGGGTRDSSGVPMFQIGTKLYDHPVRQAQDGLLALESYRISGDEQFLDQAKKDAQHLVDGRVERDGGYFFPYPFDFALHGNTAYLIRAPWYSGMAQGQALSLFSRLADVTHDAGWRSTADATFASLLAPPDPSDTSLPFVSWVDSAHHLWIDEYARQPLALSDRTFNGHIFATFGLWDYYRISQDQQAGAMFQGALANVRAHVDDGWRRPRWISSYCMTHAVLNPGYHAIHTVQMRILQSLTASNDWAVWSDRFRDDYPPAGMTGRVRFAAGTQTGYTFTRTGHITGSRSIRLRATSSAPTSTRMRIQGRGYFYLITAGSLKGYWVQERSTVYRPGLILSTTYGLQRTAVFAVGKHTGWTLTTDGLRAGSRTITLFHASSAAFDRSGWIDGAGYVRIVTGSLAGRWVPIAGLTLR